MVFAISLMELIEQQDDGLELDAASFCAFYNDALPRVYGYFLHRTGGSPALAEDLTQETFLAAVRELKKGRRPDTPIPWIYGIARHKLLDHYRRRKRTERLLSTAEADVDELAVEPDSDAGRKRVVAALDAVPASQRAALVLHHLDGFSMREVADLLGKTEKAVESLLGRGRESLKRAYLEASA
jgi:RNA polymerase sigma-70 factor (ECF subfamily)